MLTWQRIALGGGDFRERAPKVHRPGAAALRGLPGNGAVQRPIELGDAGAIAVALQFAAEARGESRARNFQKLPRRNVAKDRASVRKLLHRTDPRARNKFSTPHC